jgi:hypothetical protein
MHATFIVVVLLRMQVCHYGHNEGLHCNQHHLDPD